MTLAIGIDLQRVDFFEEVLKDRKGGFLDGHFTVGEASYCLQDPKYAAERLAARYAAKEAFLKALDTTRYDVPHAIDPAQVNYQEIEVVRDGFGRPFLKFHGTIARVVSDRGVKKNFVSLSHDKGYAIAQVVLEG